jgi:hypothetical protein
MSAIVLLVLFAGFLQPPRTGEVLLNFLLIDLCYFFAEVFLAAMREPALQRFATTPTRHSPATHTPPSPYV